MMSHLFVFFLKKDKIFLIKLLNWYNFYLFSKFVQSDCVELINVKEILNN